MLTLHVSYTFKRNVYRPLFGSYVEHKTVWHKLRNWADTRLMNNLTIPHFFICQKKKGVLRVEQLNTKSLIPETYRSIVTHKTFPLVSFLNHGYGRGEKTESGSLEEGQPQSACPPALLIANTKRRCCIIQVSKCFLGHSFLRPGTLCCHKWTDSHQLTWHSQ